MNTLLTYVAISFAAATYSAILSYFLVSRLLRTKVRNEIAHALPSEDAMTRLLSYDMIPEILEAKRIKARSKKNEPDPISLILIDIDQFKDINTRFGMEGGDRLVTDVAGLLKSNIRGSDDALFRYRLGDEFLVLCYGATGTIVADRVAGRLFDLIRNNKFYLSPSAEVDQISVSMGVTECRQNETSDQIIRRLEAALKQAKDSKGKDPISLK